ncbi:MAG: DUF1150 domain-containing protein [Rhodobacteraceae bacterium]|jgi:hypothetical protein|nr:DUF1150 domain-containing protein [Paracoccaceae bacterium]
MNTPFAFPDGPKLVYVREIAVRDLPDSLREQAGGLDVIYAVHAPNGQQLALVANKALAFHLARQHDVTPVSVH